MSRLDQFYRRLLLSKFFVKGWGNPENLKRLFEFRKILSHRETCRHLVSPDYPVVIDKEEAQKECKIIDGHFLSPLTHHLPGIMPKEAEIARFQMILPNNWNTKLKPVCVHLAGTGDHYFWRRRMLLAKPLLKEAGIASILLENPYYGVRKPKQQIRSSLHNVSDLFVMGGALVLESLVLFHWCERQGYGPLGITGISMGGHMASIAATNWHKPVSIMPMLSWSTASAIFTEMASLAATNWHKPIVLVPCLSWSTASVVFTEGVLSGAIPWKLLQQQYFSESSFEDELSKLIESPEQNRNNTAFCLGQDFARHYPDTVSKMEDIQRRMIATDSSQTTSQLHNSPSSSGNNGWTLNTENSSSSSTFATLHKKSSIIDHLPPMSKVFSMKSPSLKSFADKQETLHFMRGVMDECTHLGNFSVPVDTGLVIIIAAKSDAYIPRNSVISLEELWPGAEVRYIDTGHISAFLFHQGIFRQAITDGFEKQIKKYYS